LNLPVHPGRNAENQTGVLKGTSLEQWDQQDQQAPHFDSALLWAFFFHATRLEKELLNASGHALVP
jgi:hypothetical protein